MSQEKSEEQWPKIRQEERTLHEILFYSQGPLDGYLLGEDVRDLLLKSGLPLTVLSQIWNLADVSKDNVLNVHEFVLIMHLIRAAMSGRPVPGTLPRSLTPPDTAQCTLPPMTQKEKAAYLEVFHKLDFRRDGVIDADVAAEVFLSSQLPTETLAQIWDLSDYGRDGKLSSEEFAIACHLLRYARQGGSLNGPVDIFQYATGGLSQVSLLASKRRVLEYEEHKQRLISLKEKRKAQSSREIRRLDLAKEKLECLQELFEQLKKLGKEAEAETLSEMILKDKTDNEEQEEIVFRLKKVHEEVRQETVKIILGEQKFNDDISRIKKSTDELNKRLLSIHTYDNKEADPFHQMLEQRKENKQSSTITDLDKIVVHLPFKFSPFDLDVTPDTLTSGFKIIDKGNNHKQSVGDIKSVIADLKQFGEEFMDVWGRGDSATRDKVEEDEIFMEVHDMADDNWPDCAWPHGDLLGLADTQVARLIHKLSDIKEEIKRLKSDGGRLVFRKSEDYSVRKKALAEEIKADEGRVQRKYITDRMRRSSSTDSSRMRGATELYSYTGERAISTGRGDVNQAKRDLKLKRQSLNIDSSSLSMEIPETSDHKRKLQRSTTDPVDQSLLLSSTDQSVSFQGPLEQHQEKSLNIKNQSTSRKDNSNVLTLRSSRRKDDLSLELASIALGRTIQVEAVPPPVSSERTKHPEQVSCLSSTSEQKEKKTSTPRTADNTETNVATKQNSPKAFSTKPKASSQSTLANILNPVHDKVDTNHANPETSNEHIKNAPLSISYNKNELQIKESVQTNVISVEAANKTISSMADKRSAAIKNPTSPLEPEYAPQRPPRLNKQSKTSTTSKELLLPVVPSHSLDESNNNNTDETRLIGPDVSESTSLSNGIKLMDTQASETKFVAKEQKENTFVEHSSNELQEIPRDVSTLRSFFGQSSGDNSRKVVLKQELKNKHTEAECKSSAVSLSKDLEAVEKTGGPKKNHFTQNHLLDSDEGSIPPPLPTSPPPLCPTTVPSTTKVEHAVSGEGLSKEKHTIPIRANASGQNVDSVNLWTSENDPEAKSLPFQNKTLHLTSSPLEESSLNSAHQRHLNIADETRRLSERVQSSQTVEIKPQEQVKTQGFHKAEMFEKREHSATISKNEVNFKNSVDLSRPADTDGTIFEESVQVTEKSVKSSNPSDYGFVYSAERSQPPPEAGWSDKQGDDQIISLYGENVLKEGDTTESVDRESIANLSSTKKQWEVLLSSHNTGQEDTSVKKKVTPKWEVRVPYTEKHTISATSQDNQISETEDSDTSFNNKEDPAMYKKKVDNESAIEREIRLAFERELVLKVEEEGRQKQKQKSQGQTIITSYEAESESFQPVYNELAEADRGSDLWRVEHGRRNDEEEDENDENDGDKKSNESIIEREIRLQREREEEVERMRKQSTSAQQLQQQKQQPQQQKQQSQEQHHQPISPEQHIQHEVKDVKHSQIKNVSYEDAISKNSHEGESLIARELREEKEREEELRRLHSSLHGTHVTDNVDSSAQANLPVQKAKVVPSNSQKSSQAEPPSGQGLWQSPFASKQRRESLDSTSSHGSGPTPSESIPSRRDVQVRPIADGHDEEDKKQNYFEKQETPIEREMRLARERENELRKQKGLPELDLNYDNPYDSYGASHESSNSTSVSRPRSVGQPSDSMKKFASSRLQQELQQQKQREHELRSQGKIISTSEDHIELKKYMKVAGVDQVDGTEKRNFITKKTSVSYNESDAQQAASPGGQMTRKTSAVAAGGNMFSYKEFKQNAESKIERELREMREREEELRMRRTSCQPENSQ